MIVCLAVACTVLAMFIEAEHVKAKDRFFSNTLSYFAALHGTGTELTEEIASTSISPEHLQKYISAAQAIENGAYSNYQRDRDIVGVPSGARDIADDTDYVHREFQKSVGEFLAYWDDQNPKHIHDGRDDFKQALAQAKATVIALNAQRATLSRW